MNRELAAGLLALALLTSLACGTEQPTAEAPEETASEVDQAFELSREAYEATESPEQKIALVREFLSKYPESEHTELCLGLATDLLVGELEQPDEAAALFEEVLGRLEDPEIRLGAQTKLAGLYARTGRVADLGPLARQMAEEHELNYSNYYRLMDVALDAEAWDLLLELSDASLALANPEAYQAQYPDMTAEESERGGRRRVAISSANEGWALANLQRHDEALAIFADAVSETTYSFLGADDTDLHLYWGKTLMRAGKHSDAMDKLELEALYGSDEAMEAYKECWVAARGSEEGLEEEVWALRQKHAQPLPGFSLANYDGESVSTEDFAGDVLLIAAWNPG